MVIVLDEQEKKFVQVLDLLNTNINEELKYRIVEKKSIRVDELIGSFISIMDAGDVFEAICHDESMVKEFLELVIEEADEKGLQEVFKGLIERIEDIDDHTIEKLINTLTSNFDVSSIAEDLLNEHLRNLLLRIVELKDKRILQEIFLTLIQKVTLFDTKDEKYAASVLDIFLERINRLNHEEKIKDLFMILAEKANKDWVRMILAPYLKKQKVVRSPVLPKNCVFYLEELDGTKVVGIEVPKDRHHITYHETSFQNVGFPRMLFAFYVHGEEIKRMEICAVKDKVIKETTKLYHYPFSNVHDNFTPCWITRPKDIKNLSDLATIPYLFLSAPNNDHLYNGVNLRERFANLQERDFDDRELVSAKQTVRGFFDL